MTRAIGLVLLVSAVACPKPAVEPPPAPAAPAPPPPDPLAAALDAIREQDLVADVAWLTAPDMRGRGSDSPEARAAAARLETELRALGLETARQSIPAFPEQDNVIAVLVGGPETVIICAHYDHIGVIDGAIHPGADDNASGVAVALSLARAATAAHRADPTRSRRTLLFLFSGAEEEGLHGARAYVERPHRPLETTLAVLNFDMVGRDFFETAMARPDTFAVVGMESSESLGDAVRRAAESEKVHLVPVTAGMMKLFGFAARTDDYMFRTRNIPAVHFSTALHPDYHQPTDTPDRIKPKQMLHVARVAARVMMEIW